MGPSARSRPRLWLVLTSHLAEKDKEAVPSSRRSFFSASAGQTDPITMTQLSEFQALKALIHTNLDRYEALLRESDTPEPFLNEARTHPVLDSSSHVPDKELWSTTQTWPARSI